SGNTPPTRMATSSSITAPNSSAEI
ncbi:hypothetical protein THAOC_12319, partial [Thalassiosira oceanica]